MYEEVAKAYDTKQGHPRWMFESSKADYAAQFIRKKFSTSQEEAKEVLRLLSRASWQNPCITFGLIVPRMVDLENLVKPFSQACFQCKPLDMDVLSYFILKTIAGIKEKIKKDSIYEHRSVKAMALIAATFYKEYPSLEIR